MRDNLFYDERMRMPMEDVIADVQNKHIRIVPLATAESGNWRYASTLQISFQHPDRNRAQRFTRALTEKFVAAAPAIKILDEPACLPSPPTRTASRLP